MAVVKKKRSHHAKGSKQAQLQQQQQQLLKQQLQQQLKDSEANRLKPEQVNSIVHDESDTISFRANLLKNFILSTDFMNVLTNQPVPIDKIKPPRVFQSGNPETLRTIISTFENKLKQEQDLLDKLKITANELEIKEKSMDLAKELDSDTTVYDTLQNTMDETRQYCEKYNLRSQDRRIVVHRNNFPSLKIDPSEAPNDYWETTYKGLIHDRDMKLREQVRKEEEEKRQKEVERQRKEEQRLRDLELQERNALQFQPRVPVTAGTQGDSLSNSISNSIMGQSFNGNNPTAIATQMPSGVTTASTGNMNTNTTANLNPITTANDSAIPSSGLNSDAQQNTDKQQEQEKSQGQSQTQSQSQQPQDNLLEDMFTDYNNNENEPFSNGFDDEFGDGFENLDNVFF